jgi:hypothetical protein
MELIETTHNNQPPPAGLAFAILSTPLLRVFFHIADLRFCLHYLEISLARLSATHSGQDPDPAVDQHWGAPSVPCL